jgi:hypothetical protein
MNDALASGARAEMIDERQDSAGFYVYTHTFTVDHRIVVYEIQAGDIFSNEATARELKTCTGTFRVGEQCAPAGARLIVDGCP